MTLRYKTGIRAGMLLQRKTTSCNLDLSNSQGKEENEIDEIMGKPITLSGVEAPEVIPIVTGPSGSQFSFSTNSPC